MRSIHELARGLIVAATAVVFATPAISAEAMICETDQSYDCAPGSTCIEDNAEAIGLPPVLKIDFDQDVVHGTKPDGEKLSAKFAGEVQQDGRVVIGGIQGGLGWSMVVTEATGAMTITIAGDEIGFIVFGRCVPD